MILYVITNSANGKKYVGITRKSASVRWRQHLRRTRDGSKFALHRAIAKYGPDAFRMDVIATAESYDALLEMEKHEIVRLGTMGRGGYNMTSGGEGTPGFKHSEKERQARSARRAGVKASEETKALMRAAWKNRPPVTDETRAKMSAANKGRKMPASHSERMRNRVVSDEERERRRIRATGNKWSVGKVRTAEQRAAISRAHTGKTLSEETRAKIREKRALQEPTFGMLGKVHSDETRQKMRDAKVGKKKSPETIERMRDAARRRMAEGRNGAVNR